MDAARPDRKVATGTPKLQCRVTSEGVAVVTLNDPATRNAMGDGITPFFRHLLHELRSDPDVRCLVITGAGAAFSSGGNMAGTDKTTLIPPPMPPSPTGWMPHADDPHGDFKLRQRTATGALFHFPVPTIAALPGPAAGFGASIALACDLRVAAKGAFLATAYIDIGLPGDYGGTWTLTQLVGPAIAKELAFTNRRVYADEGLELGLFNRVVPADKLSDATLELAREIASKPANTLRRLKTNLNLAMQGVDFNTALDHEAVNLREHVASMEGREEFAEARRRFVRRRRRRPQKAKDDAMSKL